MGMESRPGSSRRTLLLELTPAILVVSVLGLGYVMYEQTSSLAAQIHDVDKRLSNRLIKMESNVAGVQADVAEMKTDMKTQFIAVNARIDEVNARIDATNVRIDGLALTVATKEDILRLEAQIQGLPTRQEFDALGAQVKALEEGRAQ